MTDSTPLITVLMPVYNGSRYVRQAIESVLAQTYPDFEYLIIDDGSTDATRDIILSYSDPRIKLFKNDHNIGLIKTLNRGLSLAKGQYIARQDHDDISHPTRLEKQVNFLNQHPQVVLLGTAVNNIDEHGNKNNSYGCFVASGDFALRWQTIFDNPFVHSTVMMRAQTVRALGGYDEHFIACEDYDLFSRCVSEYKTTNLKEVLVDYRYHQASVIANATKENTLLMGKIIRRVYKEYLRVEPNQKDIELWLSINNLNNFDTSIDITKLVGYIESTYNKFISSFDSAKNDPEIKKHISHMMVRMAYNMTRQNRMASYYLFYNVLKWDIYLACKFLPKYLAAVILGRHRTLLAKGLREYFQRKRG